MSAVDHMFDTSEAAARTELRVREMSNLIKAMAAYLNERVAARRAQRATRRHLLGLEDRLLRDIGICAADIRRGSVDVRGVVDALLQLAAPEERNRQSDARGRRPNLSAGSGREGGRMLRCTILRANLWS